MPLDPSIFTGQSSASISSFNGGLSPSAISDFASQSDSSLVFDLHQYQVDQTAIETLAFPSDRPKFYFRMFLSDYSRTSLTNVNPNLSTATQIILPLPQQLIDTHQVAYDEVQFGPLAGAIGNQLGPAINGAADGFRNTNSLAGASSGLTGKLPSAASAGQSA